MSTRFALECLGISDSDVTSCVEVGAMMIHKK